jgi:hypothetical protein
LSFNLYVLIRSKTAVLRGILGLCLALVLLVCGSEVQAGQLIDRLAAFPHWEGKPPVTAAENRDLIYPVWMAGNWQVTSTLVEQVAPLAPEVVTPGFESNRRHLNEPVSFEVRFHAATKDSLLPKIQTKTHLNKPDRIVADRAFNGLNIAKAYLGEKAIKSVKVDPNSPNRQITTLRTGRQLTSIVTGRASETPTPDQFVATEISNQVFRGTERPYFNQVETTTKYQQLLLPSLTIEADQITAVYLSPQDADYFKALNRPVALYRYQLQLVPVETP